MFVALAVAEGPSDNWPQFRVFGANPNLPSTWSTTENVEWVTDVPGVGWSSPIVWNGKVFALNEEGDTFVMSTGEEFELLGINSLDEFSMATPAVAGDRLLIRTQGKLYSICQSTSG